METGWEHYAGRNRCPTLYVMNCLTPPLNNNIFLYPLVAITIYVTLAAEFFFRFKYNTPIRYVDTAEKSQPSVSKNLKIMLLGMSFCTFCVFIR